MGYYVYILASKRNETLYTGTTNNLAKRGYEHKNKLVEGFTDKHGVHMLVYFEDCNDINSLILRENKIKNCKRKWKLDLIEEFNPGWKDLNFDMLI